MNVLMTADTVGGVFTYALELSGALGRHGAHVALATKGGVLSDDQWAEARRVPGVEIFESSDRLEWMEEPWADVSRSSISGGAGGASQRDGADLGRAMSRISTAELNPRRSRCRPR